MDTVIRFTVAIVLEGRRGLICLNFYAAVGKDFLTLFHGHANMNASRQGAFQISILQSQTDGTQPAVFRDRRIVLMVSHNFMDRLVILGQSDPAEILGRNDFVAAVRVQDPAVGDHD